MTNNENGKAVTKSEGILSYALLEGILNGSPVRKDVYFSNIKELDIKLPAVEGSNELVVESMAQGTTVNVNGKAEDTVYVTEDHPGLSVRGGANLVTGD